MSTILELQAVSKSFRQGFWGRETRVLSDLTLSLDQGEAYGFLGHNGAGKSTTMKLILGLIRQNSGQIRVFGSETVNEAARRRIGFLNEEVGVYPYFTAAEMFHFVAELFRYDRRYIRRRADELLELVGLDDARNRKIKTFSKGMRQRLGIALALVNDPELLLLDEPYSGLDPMGRKQLREMLLTLKKEGKTIFVSSHIVPDVEAVCDRVGILSNGRIVRTLDLNEVYLRATGEFEVIIRNVDRRQFTPEDYGEECLTTKERVVILRCDGEDKVKRLVTDVYASGGSILEIKPLRPGLEDLFLATIASEDTRSSKRPEPVLDDKEFAHTT